MAEVNQNCADGNFKEAVCIDAGRVYDSCCARDCLEDLRCYFSEEGQEVINSACSIRVRDAQVLKVYIDVEPVRFNRGFFSCDLTFFFAVDFDAVTNQRCNPTSVCGICAFTKKVILFGSEGNVKIFSNDVTVEDDCDEQLRMTTNMPRCVVQAANPMALSVKLSTVPCGHECQKCIPDNIARCIGGNIVSELTPGMQAAYVTLGLFTVVQLIRNVQMLVPVYDFCIPEKECCDTTGEKQPCDVFRKIKFPTEDFFPPSANDLDCEEDTTNCES